MHAKKAEMQKKQKCKKGSNANKTEMQKKQNMHFDFKIYVKKAENACLIYIHV